MMKKLSGPNQWWSQTDFTARKTGCLDQETIILIIYAFIRDMVNTTLFTP